MSLTLYGSVLSPYVAAIQVVFHEKRLDYQFVSIGPEELKAPNYERRHPFRKLPSLDVNGHSLFETAAIMRFIDEVGGNETILQPADPYQRALSEQWMSAANSYLYRDMFTHLYFQKVLAPKFGLPFDESLIAEAKVKTGHHLTIVSDALDAGTLGSELTLGDILVCAMIRPLQSIQDGVELLNEAPKVQTYLSQIQARESFQSLEVNPT